MSSTPNPFVHNPFATRHVRPGVIPYCFPPGIDARQLVEGLAATGWRGQIVGPHGSGKSTLLATLQSPIEEAGQQPLLVALHDGQRSLPEPLERLPSLDNRTVIMIDGYEQLGLWSRWRLHRFYRRRKCGLLVTSHRSVGLPLVLETFTTPELAEQLVNRLTHGEARIDRGEIAARLLARQGNMRELLFDCYDLYEKRSSAGVVNSEPTGRAGG
jgi:energy-coupling factor transporter ATP-binding protein EcfA2